jgi:YVTN family beta-propeller protein
MRMLSSRPRHRAILCTVVLALLLPALTAASASAQTAYVTNLSGASVTPFDTETGLVGAPIPVGDSPRAVAVTPDGSTAYVVNLESDDVTPIDTATATAGSPIEVGDAPVAIAVAPDGQTAYVVDQGADTVTPIDVAGGIAEAPIAVGDAPSGIAISPDGSTAYVTDLADDEVTPVDLSTQTAGSPIAVGDGPLGIAISPDGSTAYVANINEDSVSPIDLATGVAGPAIEVGDGPQEVAITPDGTKAYVLDIISNEVTPIDLATGTVLPNIVTGAAPFAVVVAPDGGTLYITNAESSTVTPVDTATDTVGAAIEIPVAAGIALVPYQAPVASFQATASVAGADARFDASESSELGGPGAVYSWDFGDGSTATTTTALTRHVYAAPGNYSPTLTVTNAGGCSTRLIFTGQTAFCNGGPEARTRLSLPIYPATLEPRSSAHGCLPRAAAWSRSSRPAHAVPGVRATVGVDPATTSTVTATLTYRRNGRAHRIVLDRVAIAESGRIVAPLPVKLRGILAPGSRVRLALTIMVERGCEAPTTSYRGIRTRVVTLSP